MNGLFQALGDGLAMKGGQVDGGVIERDQDQGNHGNFTKKKKKEKEMKNKKKNKEKKESEGIPLFLLQNHVQVGESVEVEVIAFALVLVITSRDEEKNVLNIFRRLPAAVEVTAEELTDLLLVLLMKNLELMAGLFRKIDFFFFFGCFVFVFSSSFSAYNMTRSNSNWKHNVCSTTEEVLSLTGNVA
jgi:hypothetical protein